MGAFQNIGINAYLKRYGLKNGLLRGIYMANPIHIVRDYENKKLLYYYHAKKYIKNHYEKYADEIAQYGILSYVIEDGQVALTEGTKGCIKPAGKDNVFTFESPKHYYYPISEQDMVINSNLTQISFWK